MRTLVVALVLFVAHVGRIHCWESFKKLSPEKREWLHRIAVKQGFVEFLLSEMGYCQN